MRGGQVAVQQAGRCQGGGAQYDGWDGFLDTDGWDECPDTEGLWPGHNIQHEHRCWYLSFMRGSSRWGYHHASSNTSIGFLHWVGWVMGVCVAPACACMCMCVCVRVCVCAR